MVLRLTPDSILILEIILDSAGSIHLVSQRLNQGCLYGRQMLYPLFGLSFMFFAQDQLSRF